MSARSLDTRLGSANNDRSPGVTPTGADTTVNRNTYRMTGTDHVDNGSLTGPGKAGNAPREMLFKAIAFGVVGALAMILAMVGLFLLLTAIYFHDPGPYAQNSWQGYDPKSFAGLMLFVICAPLGYVTTYASIQAVARARGTVGVWLFATLGAGSVVVGCSAMVWGKETMKCLGMFCVGSAEKWLEIPNARPEAGLGFLSTVGTSAFLSLVPFGFIILFQAFRYLQAKPADERRPGAADPLLARNNGGQAARHVFILRENRTVTFAIASVLFVFLFIFMVTTFYIPNSFEYFVAARIAKNARLQVTRNVTLCNNDYNHFTCSEVSWATYFTTQLQLSEHLFLKFYPGNVFFFTYLLSLLAFIVVIRANKQGRLFLKRHVVFGFTVGEIVLTLATIFMVANFFHYWLHDHNYNGYWDGGENRGLKDSERWARTLGQLAVMFMSLLFFPASRNSVVHRLFGTSWEASLWAHRVLGYCMLAAAFGHMVAWYVMYGQLHLLPQDVFEVPMSLPTSIDNFTVPMNTLTTWLLFLCMGFFALEPIRRRFFEVFYYAHLIAAYLCIPAVLWHAAAGWEYLLPGITVWFIDRLVRMYRSSSIVEVVSVSVNSGVTEVKFVQPTMTVSPGQYVFVNIPELALFEWHPFTISSGVGSATFSLHIKSMGPGTWTDRLLQFASTQNGRRTISLAVDGPYGHPIEYADYSRVLLVAGGIGITPCASIFTGLKAADGISATLLWSLREAPLLDSFSEQLKTAGGESASVAKVFVTRGGGGGGGKDGNTGALPIPGVVVSSGRPNFEFEFGEIGRGAESPQDVLVFVCGPERLVADAAALARQFGYSFHQETFLL